MNLCMITRFSIVGATEGSAISVLCQIAVLPHPNNQKAALRTDINALKAAGGIQRYSRS